MSEFQREHRYWVIKRKHLTQKQDEACRQFCGRLRYEGVPDVEAAVVESDWPIYEETWENVKRCAEGRPSIGDERDALAAPTRDMVAHMQRQIAFSTRAFGPGDRQAGVIDHIRKELHEIEEAPQDLEEWIDVVLLALDGAWRSGHSAEEVVAMLDTKLTKNESREWPDWRTADRTKAIEHDRTKDRETNS